MLLKKVERLPGRREKTWSASTYRWDRSRALRAVNTEMVACYWQIGRLIIEEEQQGETRDAYGKGLIKEL